LPISNSTSPRPKSENVGAIAGATVGGLAVLCLFVLALTFLILRYRRHVRVTPPAVADGQSLTPNPTLAPAELSPSNVLAELSVGHGGELDGKPSQ
jgi:hypothetical protein